jgi:hypothetical protein
VRVSLLCVRTLTRNFVHKLSTKKEMQLRCFCSVVLAFAGLNYVSHISNENNILEQRTKMITEPDWRPRQGHKLDQTGIHSLLAHAFRTMANDDASTRF